MHLGAQSTWKSAAGAQALFFGLGLTFVRFFCLGYFPKPNFRIMKAHSSRPFFLNFAENASGISENT